MQDDWKANVKAIVSLILSILSIVCCCFWYVSLILAIAAIVLGILGYRDENPNQTDAAIAGIVVGAVGLALSVTVAILYIMVFQQTSAMASVTGIGMLM